MDYRNQQSSPSSALQLSSRSSFLSLYVDAPFVVLEMHRLPSRQKCLSLLFFSMFSNSHPHIAFVSLFETAVLCKLMDSLQKNCWFYLYFSQFLYSKFCYYGKLWLFLFLVTAYLISKSISVVFGSSEQFFSAVSHVNNSTNNFS